MTTSTRKERTRTRPQLSVNQFAQYLEAKGRRRNTILRDQKFPNEVLVLYYKEACDGIVDYIESGFDESVYDDKHEEIGSKSTTTVQQVSRLKSCLEALESFREVALDDLEDQLENIQIIQASHNPSNGTLNIEGVEISLRPEFFVQSKDSKGNLTKGVIKLYVNKSHPLTDYTAKAIGTLCLKFLEDLGKPEGIPNRELVFIVDVFAQKVFLAPKAIVNVMKDVEATCKEIGRIWPSVSQDD